ncbi:MAG: hypothetical protein QOJ73_1519 [Streptosporangiaceae bacterium]|jgi:hypothetical protein|nr:hypothetical protein [Streptosporangiaceae bacterium]
MSAHPPVGVLRTVRQQAEDEPDRFGSQSPQSWDVIPGVKVRNDGVYPAVLLPGYRYQLAHDGIGWQLTAEGGQPHGYLVGDDLEPVERLGLAHRPVVLIGGRHYTVSQDEAGAWSLHEDTNVIR